MADFDINTIISKKDRMLIKPFNLRPGYDMKYVIQYLNLYAGNMDFNKIFNNERLFDNLSIIKQNETILQWSLRVRVPLQDLLNNKKYSFYHRYCLFLSYGKGKFNNFDYYRARIHKSHMAICFSCWKLIKIDDIQPKKTYHYGWQKYVEIIEAKDLMVNHWNNKCDKPMTDFGKARIIQIAWKNYKNRPESLATRVWNALKTDDYPNDKKFLGLTPYKADRANGSNGYGYIDYDGGRFFWHPNDYGLWAKYKKELLNFRLRHYVKELLQQHGYRIINGKPWYIMVKWIENPDHYLNKDYPDLIRI
ncbi:hypothetical protein Glove_115g105 [Diversispora epigaea]|uniref:Uncharacterized protein n=1 Tax=Diversispora epigaea TaxID=1348612 RepID=A0A397JAJ9_9GLOM|nr:hypothetical protein Glove_115g105 [Diversispora epigaea]